MREFVHKSSNTYLLCCKWLYVKWNRVNVQMDVLNALRRPLVDMGIWCLRNEGRWLSCAVCCTGLFSTTKTLCQLGRVIQGSCHRRCANQNLSHSVKELKLNISLRSLAVSKTKGQGAWIMIKGRCFLSMHSYTHICSRRSSRSRFTSSHASQDDVYSH